MEAGTTAVPNPNKWNQIALNWHACSSKAGTCQIARTSTQVKHHKMKFCVGREGPLSSGDQVGCYGAPAGKWFRKSYCASDCTTSSASAPCNSMPIFISTSRHGRISTVITRQLLRVEDAKYQRSKSKHLAHWTTGIKQSQKHGSNHGARSQWRPDTSCLRLWSFFRNSCSKRSAWDAVNICGLYRALHIAIQMLLGTSEHTSSKHFTPIRCLRLLCRLLCSTLQFRPDKVPALNAYELHRGVGSKWMELLGGSFAVIHH